MAIIVKCPACRARLSFPDEHAGETGGCPYCNASMSIPASLPPAPRRKPDDDTDEDDRDHRRGGRGERDQQNRDDYDHEDDEDDNYEEPRRGRRRLKKPGKVSAIGGMLLGGAIWAIIWNLLFVGGSGLICCLWPGVYFGIVWSILGIISASGMLGENWRRSNPRTLLILQIVQLVNLDIVNTIMGILGLVFFNEREVQDSLRP